MLTCLQETHDRPTATRTAKNKNQQPIKTSIVSTGVWPREVGIHRATWNNGNGLAGAGLLATATASGLCRIDNLSGRWIKDKMPYGGIENIRIEQGDGEVDDMDVDSDDGMASS